MAVQLNFSSARLRPGFAEGFAHRGVGHEFVDSRGEVARELLRVRRLEGAFVHLLERHEVAGLAVDDDFLDAADGAGDDGGFAGHGFEIDDAEGLVDRRAAEDARRGE